MGLSKRYFEEQREYENYLQTIKQIKTMSGIIAKTTNANFELVPSGSHIARCYSMVEIGTVEENYQGELKKLHKVRITWELPLETKVFNPEKGEQPFSVSKEYTLSMHEKSNLRKDLASWRGRAFTDAEATSFDITKLIGAACMINIIHKQGANGNTYANVVGVSPLPKGTTCPPQVNLAFVFSFQDFSQALFNELPEWLRTRIMTTPEYKAVGSGVSSSIVDDLSKPETFGKESLPGELTDDLPF